MDYKTETYLYKIVASDEKEYIGVDLQWFYTIIKERNKKASFNAKLKFLAARRVQAIARGWLVRRRNIRRNKAAILIQKIFRGHLGYHRYYDILMKTFENKSVEYWNNSAIKIQSYWRGYWSRKTIHDHTKLIKAQREAAKELLICVAHRLHYLLRTKQIPGIYSIRNSHCLSRIEKLLKSLKFREFNEDSRKIEDDKMKQIQDAIELGKKVRGTIKMPYGTDCHNLPIEKMSKMLVKYDQELKANFKASRKKKSLNAPPPCQSVPILDIIDSMTKFGIIKDEKKFIVQPSIVQKPEVIEKFCDDVSIIMNNKSIS